MLISNSAVIRIFRQSAFGFFIKLMAAVAAFGMNVAVTRSLGSHEAGVFFLGLSFILMLAAIGRLGLDNSLLRFVAQAFDDPERLHGVFRLALGWAVMSCSSLALLLILAADSVAIRIFQEPGLVAVLRILAFCLPVIAIFTLCAQGLQALRYVGKSIVTLSLIVPTFVGSLLLLLKIDSARSLSHIYLLGCGVSLCCGALWWHFSSPPGRRFIKFKRAELWASCFPLWGVAVMSQVVHWASQLILGAWSTSEDVAFFATAQRTAMLISFILIAINAVVAPSFAALHARGEMLELRRIAIWSVRLALIVSVPALAFMIFFSKNIMALFGEEFVQGSVALIILAVGQFVNTAAGSVGMLLSMTGHERYLRSNVFIAAVCNVILSFMFIPKFGLLGAACATAIAISLQNILGVIFVRRLLGFNTICFWRFN